MVEEDRRNKLPSNWEARKRKLDWEIEEEEARKVCVLGHCLFNVYNALVSISTVNLKKLSLIN